jgi:hypothetical protein
MRVVMPEDTARSSRKCTNIGLRHAVKAQAPHFRNFLMKRLTVAVFHEKGVHWQVGIIMLACPLRRDSSPVQF